MNEQLFTLLKNCIERIKDELLLFAVLAILLSVTFPEYRYLVLVFFVIGSISYIVKFIVESRKNLSGNKHTDNFIKFTRSKDNWSERTIDNQSIFFYSEDNNYKIVQAIDSRNTWETKEEWMKPFPDQRITEYSVYLMYGETKIMELPFVSCDGGRYFIPLPKKRITKEDKKNVEFEYYWIKNSIDYQVGEIIGSYYRFSHLKEVAEFCKINILD